MFNIKEYTIKKDTDIRRQYSNQLAKKFGYQSNISNPNPNVMWKKPNNQMETQYANLYNNLDSSIQSLSKQYQNLGNKLYNQEAQQKGELGIDQAFMDKYLGTTMRASGLHTQGVRDISQQSIKDQYLSNLDTIENTTKQNELNLVNQYQNALQELQSEYKQDYNDLEQEELLKAQEMIDKIQSGNSLTSDEYKSIKQLYQPYLSKDTLNSLDELYKDVIKEYDTKKLQDDLFKTYNLHEGTPRYPINWIDNKHKESETIFANTKDDEFSQVKGSLYSKDHISRQNNAIREKINLIKNNPNAYNGAIVKLDSPKFGKPESFYLVLNGELYKVKQKDLDKAKQVEHSDFQAINKKYNVN